MTGQDKQKIYDLLKKASSSLLGYTAKDFSSTIPDFADDIEEAPSETKKEKTTLSSIAEKVSSCTNCPLGKTRTNSVTGEGVEKPLVLVVGEGPGEDEDKTGRPFVGKAGQLLDKMLIAIGLSRNKNCYIANIVKCRPPHNRTPERQEAEACIGYLKAQIKILKPKMILALGRTASQNLLQTEEGVTSLHGKFFDYSSIPIMTTYHPSALLRDESKKRPAWEDLKSFKIRLTQLCPDYDK